MGTWHCWGQPPRNPGHRRTGGSRNTMSQFRPTYDKVFSKNKLDDYEYKPPPQHGVIEGALLKRKSKKWPLKDARWKRYWVVADGTTLRYFRNERSDDDELRGRPGFEVKVDD